MIQPDIDTCGSRIRTARCRTGITMAELARKVHVSSGYMGMVERGRKKPGYKLLCQIAEVLKCSPGWLAGNAPETDNPFLTSAVNRPPDSIDTLSDCMDLLSACTKQLSAVIDIVNIVSEKLNHMQNNTENQ